MYKFIACDTDSITLGKNNETVFSDIEIQEINELLNNITDNKITWELEEPINRFLFIKAKNYVLDTSEKRTIKGSALKATMKEPALREFIEELVDALINDIPETIPLIYQSKVKEIINLKDIKRWAHKKTITESVLSPSRTNEQKVLDAIDVSEVSQGDKLYFYFKQDNTLGTVSNWTGDHSTKRLLEKLYKTLLIFESVYPVKDLPNFTLKRNQKMLLDLYVPKE